MVAYDQHFFKQGIMIYERVLGQQEQHLIS